MLDRQNDLTNVGLDDLKRKLVQVFRSMECRDLLDTIASRPSVRNDCIASVTVRAMSGEVVETPVLRIEYMDGTRRLEAVYLP